MYLKRKKKEERKMIKNQRKSDLKIGKVVFYSDICSDYSYQIQYNDEIRWEKLEDIICIKGNLLNLDYGPK